MPKNYPELTAEILRERLAYDPETGLFTWKRASPRRAAGTIAGYLRKDGYIDIKVDGQTHLAHRLAWLHVHGRWPADRLDHRNGRTAENWIENLREATRTENNQNAVVRKDNKSGHPGVFWTARLMKWRAFISASGSRVHLGYFESLDDAKAARISAKANLHPFQPTLRERDQ